MDLVNDKDFAKYGVLALILTITILILALIINSLVSAALFWAFSTLTPWNIDITLQNMAAGAVILTVANYMIHSARGDN